MCLLKTFFSFLKRKRNIVIFMHPVELLTVLLRIRTIFLFMCCVQVQCGNLGSVPDLWNDLERRKRRFSEAVIIGLSGIPPMAER